MRPHRLVCACALLLSLFCRAPALEGQTAAAAQIENLTGCYSIALPNQAPYARIFLTSEVDPDARYPGTYLLVLPAPGEDSFDALRVVWSPTTDTQVVVHWVYGGSSDRFDFAVFTLGFPPVTDARGTAPGRLVYVDFENSQKTVPVIVTRYRC